MSVNTKRVFYVKYLADPVYSEILGRRGDVRLDQVMAEIDLRVSVELAKAGIP